MKTYKKILIAILTLHTLQTQPVSMPLLAKTKQLISSIARSPKLLLQAMGRHKVASTIAVATTTLLAIPKTRGWIKTALNLPGWGVQWLGYTFNSPRLLSLGIKLGGNPNWKFNYSNDIGANFFAETPLQCATRLEASIADVRRLIQRGANIDEQTTPYHETALHYAARFGRLEILRELIQAGANINARLNNNLTALHLAVIGGHVEIVRELIAAHARINELDDFQRPPLHHAIQRNNLEITRMLIQAGADISVPNDGQASPLQLAVMHNNLALVRTLTQVGSPLYLRNRAGFPTMNGNTPERIATRNNNILIIQYFNNLPQLSAEIQMAVRQQNLAAIRHLIDHGAPIVFQDGTSLLDQTIGNYNRTNPTVLDNIAKELIRAVGSNIRNREGQTPLHIAAQRGNLWIAEYLLRHGAQVNARDNAGNTPLHHAISPAMRNKLLRYHADVSVTNNAGETAIQHQLDLWTRPYMH